MPLLPTPLDPAPAALAGGLRVHLKREDAHELGAFKWRGALPSLRGFQAGGATGVVTASTGNHGAATAWAAQELGMRAVVYTPEATSAAKLALLERLGAELRQHGADVDVAKDAAREFAAGAGLPFFEDGAEPAQFDGYGAIAHELLDQLGEPPAAVLVPVGNGALLIGIARVLAQRSPHTRRVGVVAKDAPVMALSLDAGGVAESDLCTTFADGLAVRVAVPLAVEELLRTGVETLLVSERELAQAVGDYARAGMRVEASGAASLAALPKLDGEARGPVVLIVTGHNIDDELFERAVERPETFPA